MNWSDDLAGASTPVIVGPTAIGKTAVALALGALLPIEVISADSRQVYRGLDIATAQPTRRERDRVAHHLVDFIALGERYSAGRFAADAADAIDAIRQRGRIPVVVGGSGLYVKALTQGLFAEPPLDRPRRDALMQLTACLGHDTLVRWATRLDPAFVGAAGRQRAARAIEMTLLTGYPLSWWQRRAATAGRVTPWLVRLTAPRAVLHQRIRQRTEAMLQRGLTEEVAAALADGAPPRGPGLDGVGAREAVAVLHGELPREALADTIAASTRQYARRQETWFRHQLGDAVLTFDVAAGPERTAAAIAAAWDRAA